jgi:hypothetical protein
MKNLFLPGEFYICDVPSEVHHYGAYERFTILITSRTGLDMRFIIVGVVAGDRWLSGLGGFVLGSNMAALCRKV